MLEESIDKKLLKTSRKVLVLSDRREHCKLLQKKFEDVELIRQVIADLTERNLQSDERFTEAFIKMRLPVEPNSRIPFA